MHRLMEQARPEEKANLEALTPDERRRLAELVDRDPDAGDRVRWRRP